MTLGFVTHALQDSPLSIVTHTLLEWIPLYTSIEDTHGKYHQLNTFWRPVSVLLLVHTDSFYAPSLGEIEVGGQGEGRCHLNGKNHLNVRGNRVVVRVEG